ncbi:MAG: hypothetical protein ACKOIB_11870 [Verrucomicrobiota bacterium]
MSFREILPLIMAAALGSAATYIAVRPAAPAETKSAKIEAREPAAPVKTVAAAPLEQPAAPAPEAPKGEGPKGKFAGKFKGGQGMLPDVEGVAPEVMAKFRAASMKAFQDESVREIFTKMSDLRKRLEYASENEKRDAAQDFQALFGDLREAQKKAIMAADESLEAKDVDTILDAQAERFRERMQQGKKK